MEITLGLAALTAMEIVLGIDNIVFITIVSASLPESQQPLARRLGLAMALITRLLLLAFLYYVIHGIEWTLFSMTDLGIPRDVIQQLGVPESQMVDSQQLMEERFDLANRITVRDLVLFLGGAFLIAKTVMEIHKAVNPGHLASKPTARAFFNVIAQIALLDMVFSLDSVITAVGMVNQLYIMMIAVILAMIVMLIFAEPVSRFVKQHPTLKMLALSFLILIGVMLVAESIGAHLDKGYLYFAMAFALVVEFLNMRLRRTAAAIPID